jgi:hypothetical protein
MYLFLNNLYSAYMTNYEPNSSRAHTTQHTPTEGEKAALHSTVTFISLNDRQLEKNNRDEWLL